MKIHSIKKTAVQLLAAISLTIGSFGAAAVAAPALTASADTLPDRYLTAGPPLADITIARYPGLAIGDLDGDGDPDALAADFLGQTIFYRNGGGPNSGASLFREALANYPDGLYIDVGAQAGARQPVNPHPDLYDYDRDGDQDLFLATFNQNSSSTYGGTDNYNRPVILYFRNVNNAYYYTSNPLTKITDLYHIVDRWLTVSVGDLNNDNLPDAVVSYFERTDGLLGYYRLEVFLNHPNGIPTKQTDLIPPVCLNDSYVSKASPRLVDIDKDGLLDLFVGCEDGTVEFYENTGSQTAPSFVQRSGTANPLNPAGSAAGLRGPDVGRDAVPSFADMDGDHILDAAIANGAGRVTYYRNTGSLFAPHFTLQQDMLSPLGGLDTGAKNSLSYTGGSAVAFGDLDNDGDQDAISGGYDGVLHLYLNGGSAAEPTISEPAAQWGFPNSSLTVSNAIPALVDIDGDNDLDLFVSAMPTAGGPPTDSRVYYFENQGNPGTPSFALQPLSMGELTDALSLPLNATLAFGDLDGDLDQDLLVGSQDQAMLFYRNTGTPTSPTFAVQTGGDNPLDGVTIQFAAPSLVDVDSDGDLDCVIGEGRLYSDSTGDEQNGSVHYYRNDGNASSPFFIEANQLENPFSGLNASSFATPVLADLDGDNDLDFFSGSGFGTFLYSRNVGTRELPAYRDYQFNPLANVQPQDVNNPHAISINLGDVDRDGDEDAFIGTAVIGDIPSEFLYYLNAGTASEPVFRLQDQADNPLRDIQSPSSLLNVSFADTNNDNLLEAYVGGTESTTGFIKYYRYSDIDHAYVEYPGNNPFPPEIVLDYRIGPRLSFVNRTGNNALDAFIMRASYNSHDGVYYAENYGSLSNPDYSIAYDVPYGLFDSTNLFYYANEQHTIEPGMNGSFVEPGSDTIWVGNFNGEIYTMMPIATDPINHTNYMVRIPSSRDPFTGIYLPSPTLPFAVDINADSYVDAFVAASDGRIHFFRGTETPPPVPNETYLPLINR